MQIINREQKEQVAQIENELELELEQSQIRLEEKVLEELAGGLYADLEEIASNVTYKKEDKVVAGPKPSSPHRMTVPEYEVLSNQTRSIGQRPLSSDAGLLPDFHGMQEIKEKEDLSSHQSSVELVNHLEKVPTKKKKHKDRDSPERIIRGEGAEEHIPAMVDSQTIEMPDSGLGFNKMKEQVNNGRYVKATRLWSAANPAQGGQLGAKAMS